MSDNDDDDDPLSPAKGFINAFCIMIAIYCLVGIIYIIATS